MIYKQLIIIVVLKVAFRELKIVENCLQRITDANMHLLYLYKSKIRDNIYKTYFGNGNVKGTIVESLAFTSSHSLCFFDFSFHKFSSTKDMEPNQA